MNKFKFVVIATDVVIFTVRNGKIQILLIKMKKSPYERHWALPGGLVGINESIDAAAIKHLVKKTGVKNVYLEQLYTFGKPDRDPFGRVVSVGYIALIASEELKLRTTKEYDDVAWFPVNDLPALAYDHEEIVACAIQRLRSKLEYSNIVYGLLPQKFTFGELQEVYEIILEKKLDRRNFRKKIMSLGIVKSARQQRKGRPNRPAELYMFTERKPRVVNIL